MITAEQARNNSYSKTLYWCEDKLQPEIKMAIIKKQTSANRLFLEDDANPEELKQILKELGFKVKVTNMTSECGLKPTHGNVYNVIVTW